MSSRRALMRAHTVRPEAESCVRLCGLGFQYADAIDLLRDVNIHLAPGWTGVVGPNGAGKTTLLRLIAGELQPSDGSIHRSPTQPTTLLCRQDVTLDDAVRCFACDWSKRSRRWRSRLALDVEQIERWDDLSPGERRRWQIGSALASEPDLLLLDEPSNHLDAAARSMLLDALSRHRGIGVLVSHDRALLDELTATTLRVANGHVSRYAGSYSAVAQLWTAEREATVREAAQHTSALRRARRQLAEARDARARAERSIRARPKSLRDSDGRSVNRKARAANAEAVYAQRLGAMKTRVSRAEGTRRAVVIERRHGDDIAFRFGAAPQPIIATVDQPLFAGERRLCERVCCTVARESRIHLRGHNGAGKTSLLEAVRCAARVPAERMLLLPQELDRAARRRCLAEAKSLGREARGRTMQLMSYLGVDPAALLASEAPSPGEARKLVIASGLGRQVWCMLLDEPTNHLDLPSIERLERALAAFPGAIVLVSHDDAFASALCGERWTIDGTLRC